MDSIPFLLFLSDSNMILFQVEAISSSCEASAGRAYALIVHEIASKEQEITSIKGADASTLHGIRLTWHAEALSVHGKRLIMCAETLTPYEIRSIYCADTLSLHGITLKKCADSSSINNKT